MPQADDPENGEETFETQQNTAGFAQRPAPPDPFSLSAGLEDDFPADLTPEELDARQAAMGTQRRKGPPIPEGEDNIAGPGLVFGLGVEDQGAAPTEVKEPPDKG